jgi:hypothetical protein
MTCLKNSGFALGLAHKSASCGQVPMVMRRGDPWPSAGRKWPRIPMTVGTFELNPAINMCKFSVNLALSGRQSWTNRWPLFGCYSDDSGACD